MPLITATKNGLKKMPLTTAAKFFLNSHYAKWNGIYVREKNFGLVHFLYVRNTARSDILFQVVAGIGALKSKRLVECTLTKSPSRMSIDLILNAHINLSVSYATHMRKDEH